MSDPVNNPDHVTNNVGCAIKYLWRAGLKGDAMEDLRKAAWYVEREIDRLERIADQERIRKTVEAEQCSR